MLTVEAAFRLAAEHQNAGRLREAEALYQQILRVAPGHLDSLNNLGILWATQGRLEESRGDAPPESWRDLPQPLWDGGPIAGQRILLHAEQGISDSIQFIRYAPLIAERGGHVIVECPRTLVDLFCSVKGVRKIVAVGDPLPPFDLHTPMHSLPWLFRTAAESIPAEIPYLFPEPNRRRGWEFLLGTERSHLRVGVALAGNSQSPWTRKRDIPTELFRSILRTPGVNFFSLQAGPANDRSNQSAPTFGDPVETSRDFADTAGLMANLDLIVTAETAMAHLAGALGRPTWTLVPFVPGRRRGPGRNGSPWYPTMRLFRQPSLGDWDSVIHRVGHELERAVKTRVV
jgi:hypothetical protein